MFGNTNGSSLKNIGWDKRCDVRPWCFNLTCHVLATFASANSWLRSRSIERDGDLLGRIENEVKEENQKRRRLKEGRRRSHPCVSRSESAARRRWLRDNAGILKWRSRQASWPIAFVKVFDRGRHDVYVIGRKRERKELSRSIAELL